ncbi:hypothetical protein [Neobacillus sp.]|uniref:hypothetical protein n=1 Tax=Neobacillus sp. TaxID=2675273 RepID=UPI0028A244EC|nr:hypothetical protein [Neobacillus sp.]
MFFLPTKINLGDLIVNEAGLGSSISIGSTQKISINNTTKKNQGFGQQIGDKTSIILPIHFVQDGDVIDAEVFFSGN